MTFNHQLVNQILTTIFPLPEEFGVIIYDGTPWQPNEFSLIQEKLAKLNKKISVNFGMSKMVILSPYLGDIVIKIPFNGYFYEDNDTAELEWYPFTWANGSDCSDYCLTEYEKYCDLKTQRLDCFVAKIFYYKTIDGIKIFLQERVIPKETIFKDQEYKASINSLTLAKKWYKENKFCIDPTWIASCIDKYGKNKVERFLNYCNDIDLDILGDIHSGNYGYRNNQTPCILDYSNYSED